MIVKRHSNFLPTLVSDFWGEDLFPAFEQESKMIMEAFSDYCQTKSSR